MESTINMEQNVIIKNANIQSWNDDLERFHYSLLQLREWVESVLTAKREPFFLDFFYNDELIGKICGIISNETPLLGKLLYCYSGPAFKYADNHDLYRQCLDALVVYAKSKKCSRIYVDFWDSKWDKPVSSTYYKSIEWREFVVSLSKGETYEIHSKDIRRKIRSAKTAGVEIDVCYDSKMVDQLFKFMELTRQRREQKNRKGYNFINMRFVTPASLKKMLESRKAITHFAHMNGDIHYISTSIFNNGCFYGLFNGADENGYKLGLPCYTIAGMFDDGVKYLNFGAAIPDKKDNEYLEEFKRKMGAVPRSVFVYRTKYIRQPQKSLYTIYMFVKSLMR